MSKNQPNGESKAERGGDTSRSSSQGRKVSSGRNAKKRGNPQINEETHNPKSGENIEKNIEETPKPDR